MKQLAIAAAVSGLVAGFLAWQYQANSYERQIAEIERAQALALADTQAAHRATERDWQGKLEEISRNAREKIESLESDAADSDAVNRRLLAKVDELSGRIAGSASVASGSGNAEDQCGMLAKLFESANDRAGRLASIADRMTVAAQSCNEAYNAIRSR